MAKSGMFGVDSDNTDTKSSEKSREIGMKSQESTNATNVICKPITTSTPTSILIESLVKNLCSICEPDERKAQKIYNFICSKLFEMKLVDESYNMIEFEGMRNQYQRALYRLVAVAIGDKQPVPSLQAFWQNNDITNEWSHYYREFDEIEYIAGGGFGQVYRVKHKLDGSDYAVKKIFIRSEGIKSVRNYLSEVKTFASLNHSNVVQYKAAWLELGTSNKHTSDLPFDTDSSEHKFMGEHIDNYIYPQAVSDDETFGDYGHYDNNTDFEVSFQSTGEVQQFSHSSNSVFNIDRKARRKTRVKRNSISEGGNAICKIEDIQNLHVQAKSHSKWATLYIQMALCQTTLKQWLEKRNEASVGNDAALVSKNLNQVHYETVMEILRQLLLGIEYIHSKKIVHHDIKPSNIFVQIDNGQVSVQLGDFGLACPLQSVRHSLALGTKLYAAPEQLQGKCDSKSDMYSLGIVLFELVKPFHTDMERIHTITELRKEHIRAHCLVQQPQLASVIIELMSKYPKDRPDATTLLHKLRLNVSESELVQELRCQLAEKDDEISRLREILKNAGLNGV
ncbi:hypothetical protein RN001_007380 [Aquatica leii]|uniref:non-specific serine/threonine protein kinase n=1 Tax=Aquatica leii TaxID=1421715 RepID=A0AAN7P8M9_9COLE|nr:hypothetical protein RN001_007380 [Aquatica leii]